MPILPLGKLPPDLLDKILRDAPNFDERVILGPGTGLDCAVVDNGDHYLVYKSDPITFTADNIGWYAVQINLNDIATTGAIPKWMMTTLLLPENKTDEKLVSTIAAQLYEAAARYKITLLGGHTEITHGLDRPIMLVTMIGEVAKDKLITPKGVELGNKVLLTKGIPIEATTILASDFSAELSQILTPGELENARGFLHTPGISVFNEARLATETGAVTAMHDPTEGGISAALWELAIASDKTIQVDLDKIHIPDVSQKICRYFKINPYHAIASGALLMTVKAEQATKIINNLKVNNIDCFDIGEVTQEGANLINKSNEHIEQPVRDDIGKVYER